MASRGIDKEVTTSERKKGHYRAYGSKGDVIWEQKEFTVGLDKIPPGLADGMKACTIMAGKVLLHKWDPWSVL